MLLLLHDHKMRLHLSPHVLLLLKPHKLLLLRPHQLLLLHLLVVALPPATGACILHHHPVSVHAWFKLPAIAMQEIAREVCIVEAGDGNQLVNHVLALGVGRHPRWWRKRVVVGSLVVVWQRYLSSVANKDPGRGRRLLLPWNCECLEGLNWPSLWSAAEGGPALSFTTGVVKTDYFSEKMPKIHLLNLPKLRLAGCMSLDPPLTEELVVRGDRLTSLLCLESL